MRPIAHRVLCLIDLSIGAPAVTYCDPCGVFDKLLDFHAKFMIQERRGPAHCAPVLLPHDQHFLQYALLDPYMIQDRLPVGGCTNKIFSEHRLTRTPWRWIDLCTTLENLTQFVLHVLCFSSFGTALAVARTTQHTFSFEPVRLRGRFLRARV